MSDPLLQHLLKEHVVFGETIRFSAKRAGDHNAAAKILLFEYEGKPVGTKKQNLDDFALGKTIDRSRLELAGRRAVDTLDKMTEVFLPNDELLSSSGTFPVYFWIVRGVAPLYLDELRTFLVWFENERRSHRESQKNLALDSEVDQQFARYDTLNRSTNDAVSHRGRVDILRAAFEAYLDERYDMSNNPAFLPEPS